MGKVIKFAGLLLFLNGIVLIALSNGLSSTEKAEIRLIHWFSDRKIAGFESQVGRVHNLSSEFEQLHNIQRLDLTQKNLDSLLPEIGQLTNLHDLNLASNNLSDLPPEIGQLTNLQSLYLNGNPWCDEHIQECQSGVREIQAYFLGEPQ